MKQGSTLFLKSVIFLIGTAVLALCIFILPAGIRSDETGAYRPILIGMYIPAVPFFIGLYQALKLLDSIEKKNIFSQHSIKAIKYIKYSAFTICALYTVGMPYIFFVANQDDAPGVAALGFIFIFASLIVAAVAAVFQKLLQNVVNIKTENDLTV